METMASLEKRIETRHDFARRWKKESGRKVIGMMCKYIPEEIIHAFGALPVFIIGSLDELHTVNKVLQENTCPYMRSCLDCGMNGKYDYLDALVIAHSCDLMSKMHDFWGNRTRIPAVYLLDFPHKISPANLVYFQETLKRFLNFLEKVCQTPFDEDKLKKSIRLYNQYRGILRKIYQLRIPSPTPVSGTEVFTALLTSMVMDKEGAIPLLQDFYREAAGRKEIHPEGVRILVTGTDVDHREFFTLLEDCGATVVTDDLCTGTRYFWNSVEEKVPPLEALAKRYLENIPCSRTGPSEERYKHIIRLTQEYRVQGVVMPVLDFCDAHSFDAPYVMDRLKNAGIPVRKVEIDHTLGGLEQIRPVLEAFLEILKQEG